MKQIKKISKEEFQKILLDHKLWLEGSGGKLADLSYTDLTSFDLQGVDLSYAKLQGAILIGVDLTRAKLIHANIACAILSCVNLYAANLSEANLYKVDLRCSNLSKTNLFKTDLRESQLSDANFFGAKMVAANLEQAVLAGANLSCVDLSCANLTETTLWSTNFYRTKFFGTNFDKAHLEDANFQHALLHKAKNIPYIPMVCPEAGSFVAWKKARGKIVKLEIPEDALRSSGTGRKCRCNKAKVLAIEELDGTPSKELTATSIYDSFFIYRVGRIVEEPYFCTNRWEECAAGIHFFMNRQEAVDYLI